LLDDVESSCSRSIWKPRSLQKFDLLTILPVPEACRAPKGSTVIEQLIGKDVKEAIVALMDVVSYDLPGENKNHENFSQHNRHSGEIRRVAPPKKQQSPFGRMCSTHLIDYCYIIIIIITYCQVYEWQRLANSSTTQYAFIGLTRTIIIIIIIIII
jgi:hypothetical protein